MKYELEVRGNKLNQKFRKRLHDKYLEFRGDSLQNAIFRIWAFNPNKDLDEVGKRKKYLGKYYDFEELDLMREVFFSEMIAEIDATKFINSTFSPRSKQEFVTLKIAFNNEVGFLIQKLRTLFHRQWGFRIYQLPVYLVNGTEVKKFCLVPTDPKAINFIKNHPQCKQSNVLILKNRSETTGNLMKSLEKKLGTFRLGLEETVKHFNKTNWNFEAKK